MDLNSFVPSLPEQFLPCAFLSELVLLYARPFIVVDQSLKFWVVNNVIHIAKPFLIDMDCDKQLFDAVWTLSFSLELLENGFGPVDLELCMKVIDLFEVSEVVASGKEFILRCV